MPCTKPSKVEYAVKAVESGGTCIGIRCKDGVILATEKIITSKLLKAGANCRIATVDRSVGIVGSLAEPFKVANRLTSERFLPVLYLTASILSPEREMRLPLGDPLIKLLFQ